MHQHVHYSSLASGDDPRRRLGFELITPDTQPEQPKQLPPARHCVDLFQARFESAATGFDLATGALQQHLATHPHSVQYAQLGRMLQCSVREFARSITISVPLV
jgi:hypothetical protein